MEQEERVKWQIHIARAESLGGRALRRQVTREGGLYRRWEEKSAGEKVEESCQGLLLPYLDIRRDNQARFLPKVALDFQRARSFDRVVLVLAEPLPELLALMARHQEQGLQVTAVCAGAGELYGGEGPEDCAGPVEEALEALQERLASTSPRKRLALPYGEKEKLPLTYVGDLASAALFALRHYEGQAPLLVQGAPYVYGEMARAAAGVLGFEGRLQFGKEKVRPAKVPEAFQTMQGSSLYPLSVVLPYLAEARARGGRLKLSACVIMRDSEKDIGRCLKSLAAADEIIVVDTGSVDRSMEIAQEYTDQLYHFEWIDDFAVAKNFALSKATGDWIVFPDSDEFFTEETAGELHRIAEDYDGPGGSRKLMVRHQNVDEDLRPIGAEGAVSRIFTKGLFYVGMVHEFLSAKEGESHSISLPRERLLMKHTGYTEERKAEKSGRNEKILRKAHETGKDVPLQHYYMSMILLGKGQYEEARQEIMKARSGNIVSVNMRAELYRTWYKACMGLKDKAGMREAGEAMRKEMPNMPDSYALEGVYLWNNGKEEEAAPLLLKALELSADFLRINPREKDVVAEDMPAIARELAEFYGKQGETGLVKRVQELASSFQSQG